VFGDDTRSFLSVVRSLGRRGIEVHAVPFNDRAPALSSRYITKIHQLPAYNGTGRWISALLKLIADNQIDVLMPCCDRTILCLDAHRDELAGFKMAVPGRTALDALFDKHETRQMAERLDIDVPHGRLLCCDDTVEGVIDEFDLPLLIKPRRSYLLDDLANRGSVVTIRTPRQLGEYLREIADKDNYLVEEFFAGSGVGVSVLASEGRVLYAFQHGRLRETHSGRGSSLRQSEMVDPGMLEACRKMAAASNLTGVAMFEFRVDRASNEWGLLEVNARFWGSLPLPVSLGVDFPFHLYQLLIYGHEAPQPDYVIGKRSRNFAINAYDILVRDVRADDFSVMRLMADLMDLSTHPVAVLLGNEKSDTFKIDDLRPGFAELVYLPTEVLKRGLKRQNPASKEIAHNV
jgi:predicted ATP-grasp superfamily ATP-dependent carboligase